MTLLTNSLEAPAMLLHLILVAAVAGLLVVARQTRRRRLAPWPGILKQSDAQRRHWPWFLAIRIVGLTCLVIGIAGPRGREEKAPTLAGRRDVMIVLDVSRSMFAEQPSRLEKAVRCLRTLTDWQRLPPGTRVGLVVFAARPWLAFPLTGDFDHLAAALDRIAAGDIPSEVRGIPNAFVSGTRIGAALSLAVESFPGTRTGREELVLLSDGDDPVPGDEWLQGVTAARTHGVSVDVVAIGEPGVPATIPYRGDVLQFDGTVVKTEVQRARLDEIARRTDGLSLTLDRGELPLASLLNKRWAEMPPPAETVDPQSTANVRPARRFPWLLAALIAFLAAEFGLTWPTWLSEAVKLRRTGLPTRLKHAAMPLEKTAQESRPTVESRPRSAERWGRVSIALVCLVLVSAEPESAGRAALQRGQEAFARRDFAAALRWFDEAQPLIDDPSLAAFNRGAALFRLGQFAEAVRGYRQSLDDPAIPIERRDRARFDLGNSLLHQAGTTDRGLLEESIAAYKLCLAGEPDGSLKRDVEHNLAIAGQRLLALKPAETPPGTDPNPNENAGKPKTKDPRDPGKSNANKESPGKTGPNGVPPENADPSKTAPSLGKITSLPDDAKLEAMTPAQAAATLAAQIERIAAERRRDRQSRDVPATNGKDW